MDDKSNHLDDQSRDELVARARKGEQEAFCIIFLHYKKEIYLRLMSFVHDREVAEDLWQDTYLKAWRDLPGLKEASHISGWLLTVASNLAIDYLRRLSLVRKRNVELDPKTCDRGDCQADPEKTTIDKETIFCALSTLRPTLQKIVILSAVGFSVVEIARFLGFTTSSVHTSLSNAHKQLRQACSRPKKTAKTRKGK